MSSASSPADPLDTVAPSLTHRPEATTVSVEDLVAWVAAGRVRIPWFQRLIKWDAGDIELLFDSIYRGYPIGTLLLWKKPAEAGFVEIGSVRIEVPYRDDALWVVDGQQRVAALTGVLTSEYRDASSQYTLYFDLDARKFVRASKRRGPEPTWIPVNRAVDSEALLAWLLDRPALGERRAEAIRLGKRLREYQVPAYIVETNDEQPLRQIFHRTNRGGRPLTEAEVFEALHGAREQRASGLPIIAGHLEQAGFGRIAEKYIHMALLALCGKDLSRGSQLRMDDAEALEALPRTEKALTRTIVFLHRNAGIPHLDLMPYKRPLIMLARFFDLHPEPHPRSLVLLSRWLWRGAILERHQGNTVTTRKALNAIGDDEFGSIDRLLRDVGHERPEVHDPTLYNFNFRNARSKLHTMALLDLGPRHMITTEPLTVGELMSSGTPAHPVTIKGRSSRQGELLRDLANYVLHPPLEGGLRRALAAQTDPEVLRSHGVSPEAHDALRCGEYGHFLELRGAFLHEHVSAFLDSRAQWDAADRPPIEALLVED